MKRNALTLLLTLVICSSGFAQRSIKGKVTELLGQPISGATVQIKDFDVGTITDENGDFQIQVPDKGITLIIGHVAYQSKEVPIGVENTLDIALEPGIYLKTVVIAALGIARSEKSIPYAVQQLSKEDLNVARQTGLLSALAGKVAGMQSVTSSAMQLGFGGDVRLRGVGSLNGPSTPLFIVDGTPASTLPSMDDIESVSILKGPNATALYGQRGDAGALIITTKQGKKGPGLGIEINQSTFWDQLYLLPKYQNLYSGGGVSSLIPFQWKAGMPEEWKTFEGKFFHDYSDDSSWGPKMEGQEYIPWYAWYPGSADFGKTEKLLPQPDNVRDFYDTGLSYYNNISFQTGGTGRSVRISFTNQSLKGQIPKTQQTRNFLNLNYSENFGKKFKLGANLNYAANEVKGGGNNFAENWPTNQTNGSFNQWFHRDLDMSMLKKLRNLKSPEGILASWNHNNPDDYLSSPKDFYAGNWWFNFYSYLDYQENENSFENLTGNINLSYQLGKNLEVKGIVRRLFVNSASENKIYNILEQSNTQNGVRNSYNTSLSKTREDNFELLLTYHQSLGRNFSIEANAGANERINESKFISGSSSQGLNVPDLFTAANSKVLLPPNESRSFKNVRSIYARGSFGFKDLVYLEWSGRNDWSSALPKNNNSYFYPSLGTSFVFSELTKSIFPALNFGKLRASWAQVGSDLDPYQLSLNYAISNAQFNGNFIMTTPNTIVDENIQPSLSSAYEVGIDLRFQFDRLGLSITHYQENRINEILSLPTTWSSGFSAKLVNAGRIDRKGWEVQLFATPFSSKRFKWELQFNWASYQNKIIELVEGVTTDVSGTEFYAIVKEVNGEWGQLRGGGIKKDEQGRPILTDQGLFIVQNNTYLGNMMPDFTGGFINSVAYKNLEFKFVIDYSVGGEFISQSDFNGAFSGVTAQTAALNDRGKNVRDPVADGGGVRVEGVKQNGETLSIYVPARDYFQQFNAQQIIERSVFDRSFVKLREASLSYTLPTKKMALNKYIRSASIALVARNPWLIYAKNRDLDPSEATGGYYETSQFPNVRSFGFNLKLTF